MTFPDDTVYADCTLNRPIGRISAMGNLLDAGLGHQVALAVRGVSTLIEGYVADTASLTVTITEQEPALRDPGTKADGRVWTLLIEDILVMRTGEPLPKKQETGFGPYVAMEDPPDPDVETFGSRQADHEFVANETDMKSTSPLGPRCAVCRVREAMHS